MHVNPFLPYLPVFASLCIYGYLTGFFFLAWKRAHWGIILGYLFWIAYLAWCLFVFPLTDVQEPYLQKWFFAGLILAFIRPILTSSVVEHLKEDASHFVYMVRRTWDALARFLPNKKASEEKASSKHRQDNHQNQNTYSDSNEQARRAEQVNRETEARARREQAERERQEQARKNKPPPRGEQHDTRNPAEILGLKNPWTQEDLKAAYRREAGRTHPDKWVGKPETIRALMEEEYKTIQEAYRLLTTAR